MENRSIKSIAAELAEAKFPLPDRDHYDSWQRRNGYIEGYIAAHQELFTLEDIKKAFMEGSHWKEKWNKEIDNQLNTADVDKYIQSLQK